MKISPIYLRRKKCPNQTIDPTKRKFCINILLNHVIPSRIHGKGFVYALQGPSQWTCEQDTKQSLQDSSIVQHIQNPSKG